MEEKELPGTRFILKRLAPWVKPHYKTFLLCLGLLLFSSSIKVVGPILLQKAVDDYIFPKNMSGLIGILSIYLILLITGFVASYIEVVKLETVGQGIIAGIKNKAFKHVLSLDMNFFDQTTTGKLVSQIENDANAMKVLFTTVIVHILGNLVLFFGMFVVMATQYSSRLAMWVLFMFPIMIAAAAIYNKLMAPHLVRVRRYVADVSSYITETVQGMKIIQIFGQEEQVASELEEKSLKTYRLQRWISITMNGLFNMLFFAETIGTVMVLWIGGTMVMNGEMTIGSLILFMQFLKNFFVPIMFLSGQFNEFQKGMAGATRVFQLFDFEKSVREPPTSQVLPEEVSNITFENVWFRYSSDSEWVLKDVSFECPAGEHWAIVGPTGSGKTTIISLILKFYEPQKGRILLNGIDLKDLSQSEIRHRVGLVLQDNILFPGTVRDNLTFQEGDFSQEQICESMKQLGIDNLLKKLPSGYQTNIQENATNLSAGEKQLLSFGRAFLKNPSVLILDEATSNIDPETERKIQYAMNVLLKGRTALIIAHRLLTIHHADRILVLKNGVLIEQGNHQELILLGGFYADLNALQAV